MSKSTEFKARINNNVDDIKAAVQKSDEKFSLRLQKTDALLERLGSRSNFPLVQNYRHSGTDLCDEDIWLCQVDEITFVDKAPQKEGVENILGTFRGGLREFNFVWLILGDGQRIRFYLGVVRNKFFDGKSLFRVEDIGEKLLKPAIEGNFRGCKLRSVPNFVDPKNSRDFYDKRKILDILRDRNFVCGIIEGIPGTDLQRNISEGKKENFQGVDRLIDVMQGCKFGLAVIARPCSGKNVDTLSRELFEAADLLAVKKISVQHSTDNRISYNRNSSISTNSSASETSRDSNSDNFTFSENSGTDNRTDTTNQISKSTGTTFTDQSGHNKSYEYNRDCGNGGKDRETTRDSAEVRNKSVQDTTGKNYGFTVSENKISSKSESKQRSDSHSHSDENSKSVTDGNQHSNSDAGEKIFTLTRQLEVEPKLASDLLKYIDEVLLPRIDSCNGKGIFNVCMYAFAEDEISFRRLTNTTISLFTGSKDNRESLRRITFGRDKLDCRRAFENLQIPAVKFNPSNSPYETVACRVTEGDKMFFGHWMSAKELALITGFPQREILGLKLREEVEFGLNAVFVEEQNRIELGKMIQCGRKLDGVSIALDKTQLDKHTFIAGVTGSGKTTTCQNILIGCGLPFLVIEPAKTEYRALNTGKEIVYFTPGKQHVAPFFLNPFELFPGEDISSRADMLTATFEASFEMEAAIPQIMESAIYLAYRNKGWNVSTGTWKNSADPFAEGVCAFPTLADFKTAVKSVIFSQGFDDRLRDEYLGSINARLESLLVGAKGQMLNTARSIDFVDLVKRQAVIELEEIKSGAEKSLLMGFILTNLLQAVKLVRKTDKNFRHITLIEEAHRLLSRYMPGDNRNRKQGVEVFTDMLAEVRKYGEAFIIADQIPDKMTPEVLKNTSTKIVHKLFAKDDKDAIGNTISLTDEQKNFLSNLPTGRAVVFSQGWDKAIQVAINKRSSTEANDIPEAELHRRSLKYFSSPEILRRGIVPGLEKFSADSVTPEVAEKFLWLQRQSYGWLNDLRSFIIDVISGTNLPADVVARYLEIAQNLREPLKIFGEGFLTDYIEKHFNDIIAKPEDFRQATTELFAELKSCKRWSDAGDKIKIYVAQMEQSNLCKFPRSDF